MKNRKLDRRNFKRKWKKVMCRYQVMQLYKKRMKPKKIYN